MGDTTVALVMGRRGEIQGRSKETSRGKEAGLLIS